MRRSVPRWVLTLLIVRLSPRMLETVGPNPETRVRRVVGRLHLAAARARVRVKKKVKERKATEKVRKEKAKGNRKGAANSWEAAYWDEEDWSNYQLQSDGNWLAKDWDNGWLGDDGVTWVNPTSDANTDAQAAAGLQGQMSTVRAPPPGAGSTLVRQGRSLTKKDIAPAANQVLDSNGQLIQLSANADEFQWGVGVNRE